MARYCATNLHFLLFVSLTYVPRYSQCHCTKFCVSLIVAHNSHITVVYLYPHILYNQTTDWTNSGQEQG